MPVTDQEYAALAGRIRALQNPVTSDRMDLFREFQGLVAREPSREQRTLRHLSGRLGMTVVNCRYESVPVPEDLLEHFTTPTTARVNPVFFNDHAMTCDDCNRIGNREDGESISGRWVCRQCVDNNYAYSERTEEYVRNSDWDPDIHEYDEDEDEDEDEDDVFASIPTPAPRPGSQTEMRLPVQVPDTPEKIYYRDADGNVLSKPHYTPGGHVQSGIYNYSDDPMRYIPGFRLAVGETRPQTKRPFFMGVELEVAVKGAESGRNVINESVRKVSSDIGDFAIIKSDGSVSACGYELVSVPGTLAFHHQAWDRFFARSAKLLEAWSVTRCSLGLHVHIDRKALGRLGSGKLMVFLHSPANRKFVTEIAGRSRTEYAHYWGTTKADAGVGPTRGHYDAAGPSRNHHTIEVRIFKANVAKRGFFRSLEFIDALCHFVQWASIRELTVEHFLRWMQDPEVRARYPAFEAWLIGKKMIEKGKRPTEEVEYA